MICCLNNCFMYDSLSVTDSKISSFFSNSWGIAQSQCKPNLLALSSASFAHIDMSLANQTYTFDGGLCVVLVSSVCQAMVPVRIFDPKFKVWTPSLAFSTKLKLGVQTWHPTQCQEIKLDPTRGSMPSFDPKFWFDSILSYHLHIPCYKPMTDDTS